MLFDAIGIRFNRYEKNNVMIFRSLLMPYFLLLTLIFCANGIIAQTGTTGVQPEKLLVGISGGEPFVFNESKSGISLEIWDKIAKQESWKYEYISFKNVDDALHDLTKGNIDLVVGPISITARRLEKMWFSQPFYSSSISIISRIDNQGLWGAIKPLFSFKLLIAIGIFLIS